jgi:hypothetical protein
MPMAKPVAGKNYFNHGSPLADQPGISGDVRACMPAQQFAGIGPKKQRLGSDIGRGEFRVRTCRRFSGRQRNADRAMPQAVSAREDRAGTEFNEFNSPGA